METKRKSQRHTTAPPDGTNKRLWNACFNRCYDADYCPKKNYI